MEKIGLLVPTRNGGELWRRWLEAFASQTARPEYLLVIDSSSDDSTAVLAKEAGFNVRVIPEAQFNHGGTRQLGMIMLTEADIVVLMTQDAILATPDALKQILACLADQQIGAVYGRQLPAPNAGTIEAHARFFNYSSVSTVKSLADTPRLGIKAAFMSNSFAAYRREALEAVGGFPGDVILAEDMVVAARMLMQGWQVAYCAEAMVYHSHDYSMLEEFRRYFDTGVLHAREKWLLETFGNAEGSGKGFVLSELAYLAKNAPWLIPVALMRTGVKYLGYRLGRNEAFLPAGVKPSLSMNRAYWQRN
ncbi:MAG: glycosyltransferase [Sulfurimicrobium sp.]|nr:glycosyltransferase [Sulfurimicrobium sp.]MDP3687089.1 glycosyltransferase [Sulfurimicrobium sp.]